MTFALDEVLERDTFPVMDLPLCRVLLMNNKFYPWFILVPREIGIWEITDMSDEQRLQLMEEVNLVAKAVQVIFTPAKLNLGALGNCVRQFHFHIIGRYQNDKAWPDPVWGRECECYTDEEAQERIGKMRDLLCNPVVGQEVQVA